MLFQQFNYLTFPFKIGMKLNPITQKHKDFIEYCTVLSMKDDFIRVRWYDGFQQYHPIDEIKRYYEIYKT